MKSLPLTKALLPSALVAVAAFATPASAADHRDGNAVKVEADIPADINDVFAFMDGGNAILGMTVFPAADTNSDFSDAAAYQFHVNKHAAFLGASAGTTDAICTFETPGQFECWLGDDYATGPTDDTAGTTSVNGSFRVFAGLRADPFYFNLAGFNAARAAVVGAAPTLTMFEAGCPLIDAGTAGAVRSLLVGEAPDDDFFAALNTLAIVIEADPALFVDMDNPYMTVWASTNRLGN